MPDPPVPPSRRDRILGCLLGGAVGDALGADIEFASIESIRARYGPDGVTGYTSIPGRITDDTQMSLFTAEGLLRSHNREAKGGRADVTSMIHESYLRWLVTQQRTRPLKRDHKSDVTNGWLMTNAALYVRRAPGTTCLRALESGRTGTLDDPINDRKGCGGVMRVAPCGLVPHHDHFALGAAAAAITHGHPTGYLAGGALALIISAVLDGSTLEHAVDGARQRLDGLDRSAETASAIDDALALAQAEPVPSPELLSRLGDGWIAEQALAISLYCALTATTFEHGVLTAVNHSGDSDSTGAITGNLLGAARGLHAIPAAWLDDLHERTLVEQVANDLHDGFSDGFSGSDTSASATGAERYPG